MPDRLVNACPNCDSARHLHEREGTGNIRVGDPDDAWVCYGCRASFEKPIVREEREWTPGYVSDKPRGASPDVSEELLERVRRATDPSGAG